MFQSFIATTSALAAVTHVSLLPSAAVANKARAVSAVYFALATEPSVATSKAATAVASVAVNLVFKAAAAVLAVFEVVHKANEASEVTFALLYNVYRAASSPAAVL